LNVDRENVDSFSKDGYWLLSGFISKDKQIRDIQDISFYLEKVQKVGLPNYGFAMMFQYDGTISGIQDVQNEGYLQARYRDFDTRRLSLDPFVQYQWNGLWGLESRFLYGSNLRLRLFDSKGEDTYASIGLFFQNEKWIRGSESLVDKQLRINTSLKSAEKLTDNIDIVNQVYFQMPSNLLKVDFDLRLYHYLEIVYSITEQFQLGLNSDIFWNKFPLGETESWMYGYGVNLRLQL